MAICWERAVSLTFHLCCFNFSAVLVVRVPFPFGVWGMMCNSIVLVPTCIYGCLGINVRFNTVLVYVEPYFPFRYFDTETCYY